ncbi:MAG: hypothetical protein JNM84_25935, partial [Planctomycetes bacterium]|nr:hypothetical protein [Planctomycetota bacterium]
LVGSASDRAPLEEPAASPRLVVLSGLVLQPPSRSGVADLVRSVRVPPRAWSSAVCRSAGGSTGISSRVAGGASAAASGRRELGTSEPISSRLFARTPELAPAHPEPSVTQAHEGELRDEVRALRAAVEASRLPAREARPSLDFTDLSQRVWNDFERRFRIERQRRGL